MDDHNNKTCIISTFPSVHLPSFMSMDQTVLSYRRIRILRTDGRTIGHTDTRTEVKSPPVTHLSGTNKCTILNTDRYFLRIRIFPLLTNGNFKLPQQPKFLLGRQIKKSVQNFHLSIYPCSKFHEKRTRSF